MKKETKTCTEVCTELTEDFEQDQVDLQEVEKDVEHYPTLDEIAQDNGFMSWGDSYNY